MSRLPFASLVFVLFLASNFGVSSTATLFDAIKDIGKLQLRVEVK